MIGGVKGKITRQADTNVIAFKFNALTEPSYMHTGDAIVCSNKDCMAILSHLSKLKKNAETGAKVILWNKFPLYETWLLYAGLCCRLGIVSFVVQ